MGIQNPGDSNSGLFRFQFANSSAQSNSPIWRKVGPRLLRTYDGHQFSIRKLRCLLPHFRRWRRRSRIWYLLRNSNRNSTDRRPLRISLKIQIFNKIQQKILTSKKKNFSTWDGADNWGLRGLYSCWSWAKMAGAWSAAPAVIIMEEEPTAIIEPSTIGALSGLNRFSSGWLNPNGTGRYGGRFEEGFEDCWKFECGRFPKVPREPFWLISRSIRCWSAATCAKSGTEIRGGEFRLAWLEAALLRPLPIERELAERLRKWDSRLANWRLVSTISCCKRL